MELKIGDRIRELRKKAGRTQEAITSSKAFSPVSSGRTRLTKRLP